MLLGVANAESAVLTLLCKRGVTVAQPLSEYLHDAHAGEDHDDCDHPHVAVLSCLAYVFRNH
ncbi:hypothetical protein RERY_63960 [Rhodococcus erythropolis]|nr:hypothetical protein RERY_63960 [Rhodococcus erythropolis]